MLGWSEGRTGRRGAVRGESPERRKNETEDVDTTEGKEERGQCAGRDEMWDI
jgi:hypothetical protein